MPGGDPGPLTDYYEPTFTLHSLEPGRQFLNVKKKINGQWSTVAYWEVDVPEWSEPTPEADVLGESVSETGTSTEGALFVLGVGAVGGIMVSEFIRSAVRRRRKT